MLRRHIRRVIGVVIGRRDWVVLSNGGVVLRRERTRRGANRWIRMFLEEQGHHSVVLVNTSIVRLRNEHPPLYPHP